MARRALAHVHTRTTDQAPDSMTVPVADYHDAAVWDLEVRTVFRTLPQVLALSAELPEPGCHKAVTVAGVPVLVKRGADGVVRTFLNVCRHRGARLCAPGTGRGRRITCEYHGWTYSDTGALVGVTRADHFGTLDRDLRALTEFPCQERYGLIWAVLAADGELDLDAWLGPFADELSGASLDGWHLRTTDVLPGGNWKVVLDGFLEGYHAAYLHRSTLESTIPNLVLFDAYGPHQRMVFLQKSLMDLAERPEAEWVPEQHCVPQHIIFPNVAIAGLWQEFSQVCVVVPGGTADTSLTYQTVLTREPVRTKRDDALVRRFRGRMLSVAREDYSMTDTVQAGLLSGANTDFVLGRNEVGVQRFHRWLYQLTGRLGPLGDAADTDPR